MISMSVRLDEGLAAELRKKIGPRGLGPLVVRLLSDYAAGAGSRNKPFVGYSCTYHDGSFPDGICGDQASVWLGKTPRCGAHTEEGLRRLKNAVDALRRDAAARRAATQTQPDAIP